MAEDRLDVVEKAKRIREILKQRFSLKFTVRSDRYSLGECIDIHWVDGPPEKALEDIVFRFEHVDRDQFGEILSGGNSYVHCHREISPEVRQKVQDDVWNRFVEGTFKDRVNDYKFDVQVAKVLGKSFISNGTYRMIEGME